MKMHTILLACFAFGLGASLEAQSVLYYDDFTGPLTWNTSHSSVHIKDNEFLYIGTGGSNNLPGWGWVPYDDWAEKTLSLPLSSHYPIIIEQRVKLESGGRGYVLPSQQVSFENGSHAYGVAGWATWESPPRGDWAFGERVPGGPWNFTGNRENPVPGENYWTVTRMELTSNGGTLYMKPDDASRGWFSNEFNEVGSATWSDTHSSIEAIRFTQPWDSINYVDWIKVTSGDPGGPAAPPRQPRDEQSVTLPDTKKLVMFTHGWRTDQQTWDSGIWNEMRLALMGAHLATPSGEWGMYGHDWTEKSGSLVRGPGEALTNGFAEGLRLGEEIGEQGYDHIHLIAHSAGSNLISTIAAKVRELSPDTEIHTTFLDPYAPLSYYESYYGINSTWADNYSSFDKVPWTQPHLPNAHNVAVTEHGKGHAEPIKFYTETIRNPSSVTWENYGFQRGRMASGWSSRDDYPVGNDWVVLGGMQAWIDTLPYQTRMDPAHRPVNLRHIGEGFFLNGTSIEMETASPAWISMELSTTEPVNFVSFDLEFLSEEGAEGLLAMYWDGEPVGTIDERYAFSEMHTYTMWLSDIMEPGAYELAFRLDPFTEVQSKAVIDNVRTGLAMLVPEPSTFVLLVLSACGLLIRVRRKAR